MATSVGHQRAVALEYHHDVAACGQLHRGVGARLAVELSADNYKMLYVPEGFAHGFQTLAPESEVFYLMSKFFAPDCARSVRWNDPAFWIQWPLPNPILSPKDQSHPDFRP